MISAINGLCGVADCLQQRPCNWGELGGVGSEGGPETAVGGERDGWSGVAFGLAVHGIRWGVLVFVGGSV